MVKSEIAEWKGWYGLLIVHPMGGVDVFRHRELRDFAGGREKKRKEGKVFQFMKSRLKVDEMSPIGIRIFELRQ